MLLFVRLGDCWTRDPRPRAAEPWVRAVVTGVVLLLIAGCAPASQSPAQATHTPTGGVTPAQVSALSSPVAEPTNSSISGVQRWSFDGDAPGGLPAGAQAFSGTWAVRAEEGTPSPPNALCQSGQAEFPALTLGDAAYADVALSAHFKPISGQTDQAAGLIFRVQDNRNYYILRANALEGNVNFYIYRNGSRSDLKGGSAHVATGAWQELRVEVHGNRFRGVLNGQQVVEAVDDTYKTGRIGLWTKSDSVTCFDEVQAGPLDA
jgi:Domain of Unknown Function (DUF1080)